MYGGRSRARKVSHILLLTCTHILLLTCMGAGNVRARSPLFFSRGRARSCTFSKDICDAILLPN